MDDQPQSFTKGGIKRIKIGQNSIKFWQDFYFKIPVPASVEFTAERIRKDAFCLTGDGYGNRGNYGNGSIYVYRRDLPKHIDRMLMKMTRGGGQVDGR